eukprot:TRINITY_DN14070_c0_g1_i1.p1 TRINITY_DN14070_c0_g1~~TRINITY_DN14070_c0_g1_i1.p1  ORF type:complete len:227 (-),score=44.36 TRINITY_DN14070_c0_g1_i1:182-862(-)
MRENVLRCLLKLLVNRNIMRNLDNYVYRGNGAKGGEQSKREPSTQDASAKIFSQSTEATPEQPENNKRATEENTKRCNKGRAPRKSGLANGNKVKRRPYKKAVKYYETVPSNENKQSQSNKVHEDTMSSIVKRINEIDVESARLAIEKSRWLDELHTLKEAANSSESPFASFNGYSEGKGLACSLWECAGNSEMNDIGSLEDWIEDRKPSYKKKSTMDIQCPLSEE